MALPRFARPAERRVIAGVCAGIAQALAVDVTLVRLVFALLALAGGAGILLYLALWSYGSSTRPWWALLVLAAGVLLLHAFGLSNRAVVGIALVAAGLALVWHRRGSLRPDSPRAYAGLALAGLGVVLLLQGEGGTTTFLPPGAVAGALLLVVGPWLWRLAVERDTERTARIRTEERAEVAARGHDSVRQTLALIQRHATEPRRAAPPGSPDGRNASCVAGSTRTGRSVTSARRSSRRSRLRPPRSKSCTASASNSRAPATARSTTARRRWCWPRARRWRTRRSSRGSSRSTSTSRPARTRSPSSSVTAARGSNGRRSRPTGAGWRSRSSGAWSEREAVRPS